MYIVDDPMLALIARFVGGQAAPGVSDEAFMQRQIEAIRAYVERFPDEEREMRAREWIEGYARQYRQRWQMSVISEQSGESRCPDCPLLGDRGTSRCAVHDRWLRLLNSYVAGEISSKQYVEDTLALLNAHKERIRVAVGRKNAVVRAPAREVA